MTEWEELPAVELLHDLSQWFNLEVEDRRAGLLAGAVCPVVWTSMLVAIEPAWNISGRSRVVLPSGKCCEVERRWRGISARCLVRVALPSRSVRNHSGH